MAIFLSAITFLILGALGVAALGVQIRALADCLRTPTASFQRVDKRTKLFWGALTGASVFFGVTYLLPAVATSLAVGFPVPPNMGMALILNLAGTTAAGVYLADVRPALAEIRGNQNRGMGW